MYRDSHTYNGHIDTVFVCSSVSLKSKDRRTIDSNSHVTPGIVAVLNASLTTGRVGRERANCVCLKVLSTH